MNKLNMATTPVSKLVFGYSLPGVVSTLANSGISLTDSFFAARLGAEEMAAVGLVFTFSAFVQAVEYTIALGGGTWISRLLGEEKKEQGYGVATATLWFSLVVGAIIALLGWWQSDFIVGFLGAEGELLPISVAYFLPMVLSSPLLGGTLALTCIWRAQGKAVFSMMGMAVGFGVNILADYALLSFGSFGVAAIGWGTFMGYGVSFLVLLIPFAVKEKGVFGNKHEKRHDSFKESCLFPVYGYTLLWTYMVHKVLKEPPF
jgi:Na+-driven multidrug efflux pump